MPTEKLSALASPVTVLGTELNALGDAAQCAPSSAFDNSSDRNRFAFGELIVEFGSNPTDKSTVDLFMLAAPDATNYSDGNATIAAPQSLWVGSFQVNAHSDPQRLLTKAFELKPCLLKFLVRNNTSQAFVAS